VPATTAARTATPCDHARISDLQSRCRRPRCPRPAGGAVTFDDLQRGAPVPALCEHDPGPTEKRAIACHKRGIAETSGIALNYETGAYKVAFGDPDGGRGRRRYGHPLQRRRGLGGPETVQLYTAGPKLDIAGPTRLGWKSTSATLPTAAVKAWTDLSISDGVAHVTWMANGPNDGACCPTVKMMADLRGTVPQ